MTYSKVLGAKEGLLCRWHKTNRSYHCHLHLWGSVICQTMTKSMSTWNCTHQVSGNPGCHHSSFPFIFSGQLNISVTHGTHCVLFLPCECKKVVCSLSPKWLHPGVHLTPLTSSSGLNFIGTQPYPFAFV